GVEERTLLEVLRGARAGGASGLASGGPAGGGRLARAGGRGGVRGHRPAPRRLSPPLPPPREPNDAGVHPPFSLTALVQGLDPETAALAQAVIARRDPNPRDLSDSELAYNL